MASIQPQQTGRSARRHHSLKIDMTPMVDLGFLLITFFIFTTALAHPTVTRLVMPADGKPTEVMESKTLTAVLDGDKVWTYHGRWEEALRQRRVTQTNYNAITGLGEIIRIKQRQLETVGKKGDLVLLVKPLPSSSYGNVVAALDEAAINNLKHYAVVDASEEEKAYVAASKR